jgi:hypothetical protein
VRSPFTTSPRIYSTGRAERVSTPASAQKNLLPLCVENIIREGGIMPNMHEWTTGIPKIVSDGEDG